VESIIRPSDMKAWSRARHREGERIAFVPTLGALHEGHLSLIRLARSKADRVVASVFLNPTQFDREEDLEKYPSSLEADLALLTQEGVDVVYLPERGTMYPDGYATFVNVVGPLSETMCAMARPGHFRGVTTVVAKLFNTVEPDVAVFGQKDLQQVLIIGRMIGDLDYGIELVVGPTVREVDGLAMSSRNRRLSPAHRQSALALPRGLEKANRLFKDGERNAHALSMVVSEEILVEPETDLDYADVIKLDGFVEVEHADEGCILAAACFIGGIRLIDHIHLGGKMLPVMAED
jgi:pantoate--beta-alanine ligase